jgi:hypothetical protein
MDSRFEAYCCDRLDDSEWRLAESHLKDCSQCREELAGLNAVDPLVKDVFRHRLSVARSPRAPQLRLRVFPVAATALAIIAVVTGLVFIRPTVNAPELPPVAIQAPVAPTESVEPKPAEVEPDVARAKPDEIRPAVPPSVIPPPGRLTNGEPFAVIDAAGYVRHLEDFRGYVLVVGVWSDDQPQAAQNLDQVYRTFASNANFRLLGVANGPQNVVPGATFPIVYNYDSRLLGAKESEFVVIDAKGTERLRGSLLTDTSNLLQGVRSALQ